MNINYVAQRYRLNWKRHKLTFYVAFPLFGVIMALLGSIYSGPDMNSAFLEVPTFQTQLGYSHFDNPGMLIWFLLFLTIFELIFPVVGIFYGIRMLPFNERDGKELIFSTKMSPIVYFIENFIIVVILVPLTALSVFLVSVLFLRTQMPLGDAMSAMAIATILPSFFVMLIAMVTVFGASIKSSSRLGYAFGGFFYMICFMLNLIVSEVGKTSIDIFGVHIISIKDISLMSQMNIIGNVLAPTINESHFTITQLNFTLDYNSYLVTCTVLILLLFFLTLLFLFKADFIEPRTSIKHYFRIFIHSYQYIGGGFVSFLVFTRLYRPLVFLKRVVVRSFTILMVPINSFLSTIGKKYPAFRDQLKSSSGFFIIYTIATTMLVIVVLLAYPGDKSMKTLFTSLTSVLDNPLIAGFLFGHSVNISNSANLEGFILFKLFTLHWLYYGPYLFIATYYIIMRDKSNKYDEITWSLPRTRTSVLISRTAAMIVYFWITIFINWLGIPVGYVILKTYMDVSPPDAVNTLVTFFFIALGYSLFLILFLAVAIVVNSRYIIISLASLFIFSIFVPMLADVMKLTWLEYLSPFKYFDVIGLMLKDVNITQTLIPTILIGGIIVLAIYYYSIKVVSPRKDIT